MCFIYCVSGRYKSIIELQDLSAADYKDELVISNLFSHGLFISTHCEMSFLIGSHS